MRMSRWLTATALTATAVLGMGGVAFASAPPGTVTGVGVGSADTTLDWAKLKAQGVEFAYVEDTSGTISNNPVFTQEYQGARGVGMLAGAVHFAMPDTSSGTAQADYFLANGGGWTAHSGTLPPVLDLEWNPFGGNACYGLSTTAMANWITAFVTEVHAKTTRWPVIYTAAAWWSECTGNQTGFAANDPLWTTESSTGPGTPTLPYNWTATTFLSIPDDSYYAYYNGTLAQLTAFANG